MKITYKNKKAEKRFSIEYQDKWKYPDNVKIQLVVIRDFITDAESFQDLAMNRPLRLEKLLGNLKDQWSIRVGNTAYRITLIPCDDNEVEITSGDILAMATTIKIVEIVEVSNHYE